MGRDPRGRFSNPELTAVPSLVRKGEGAICRTYGMVAFNHMDRVHLRNVQSTGRRVTEEVISTGRKTSRELDGVDQRIDRLVLLCEAMWGLIQEHTPLTEQDLHERMLKVDEHDGVRNMRRQRIATDCRCGAKVPPTRPTCQFCHSPAVLESLWDIV